MNKMKFVLLMIPVILFNAYIVNDTFYRVVDKLWFGTVTLETYNAETNSWQVSAYQSFTYKVSDTVNYKSNVNWIDALGFVRCDENNLHTGCQRIADYATNYMIIVKDVTTNKELWCRVDEPMWDELQENNELGPFICLGF